MIKPGNTNGKPRFLGALLAGLGIMAIGASASVTGCVIEQPDGLSPLPSGGVSSSSSGGNSSGGSVTPDKARALFNEAEPELMKTCGGCHNIGGAADTPFLAPPSPYKSMVSWPGILARDPAQSLLLTYAMTGKGHSGTNLDSSALKNTLLPKVKAWLQEEAAGIAEPQMETGPAIVPFVPIMGFNAVYLGPLGPDFEGMAITFTADMLTETALQFNNIEVHPTSKKGVKLVHPLFVVYSKGQDPDPDTGDSFSNVDQTFAAGQSGTLGPGTFVLVNFREDAKVSIAFEMIEAQLPPQEGEPMPEGGCKALNVFNEKAKPRFQVCTNCHTGNNGQAKAALDMSQLANDPAKACAQIKNRVSPGDPQKSQIFITTDPGGNAAHPYKFGGEQGPFNNFRNDVSEWIAAEK